MYGGSTIGTVAEIQYTNNKYGDFAIITDLLVIQVVLLCLQLAVI